MEEIYRSQFRLPYALYEQLKGAADLNHRSVNAELVARLEQSFPVEAPVAQRKPKLEPVPFAAIALSEEIEKLKAQMELVGRLAEQVSSRPGE